MKAVNDFFDLIDAPAVQEDPIEVVEYDPKDKLLVFSNTERRIIELALSNNSADTIALKMALPPLAIKKILAREDISGYIRSISEELNAMEVARLKSLYASMIDARVEEGDGDMSKVSKKDTLDIMKAYGELIMSERKTKVEDKENNVFVNILNQIMV